MKAAVVVIAALFGMLFGAWASSKQGASLPNSRLASLSADLEKGRILLIADVPSSRVDQVETILVERHPDMRIPGEESHIPTFP